MATIETIPLIMVFVFLLCYEFGVFGIIHTGIMQSISARAYAFETFKGRSSLLYLRDDPGAGQNFFGKMGDRVHGISSEARTDSDPNKDGLASTRPLRVGIPMQPDGASNKDEDRHDNKLFDPANIALDKRNTKIEVSPVWIQIQYGICLNTTCGG